MKTTILPSLCVATIAACSGTVIGDPVKSPAKPSVISVEEKSSEFYGKSSRKIAPDAFRERVDYQSELSITVNSNRVLERVGQMPSVLASLTAEEKAQLDAMDNILQSARDYLKKADEIVRAFDAHKGQPFTTNWLNEMKGMINRRALSGLNVLTPVMSYLDVKIQKENPGVSSRRKLELQQPYFEKLYGDKLLNLPGLSAFINAERGILISQALQDARSVRSAGSIHLRMRSTILQPGKSPMTLHVRNYDTLEDADVAQEPRISFKMSEEDRQRITAQVKVIGEAVKLAEDLKNRKSEIRKALDEILPGIRGDVQGWKDAVVQLDDLKRKLADLAAALEKAEGSSELNAALKESVSKAKKTFNNVSGSVQKVRDVIKSLTENSSPANDPAEVLIGAVDRISSALVGSLQDFETIKNGVIDALEESGKLAKEITEAMRSKDPDHLGDLVDAFKPVAAGALPRTAEAITNLMARTVQQYPELVRLLSKLGHEARVLVSALNLPPIQDDPNLIDVTVFNPPDGAISLARNVARGDLTVTLDASLITRDENGKASNVTSIHHQEFNVQKFGLINTWSANLIFVKRLGNLAPGERKVQFAPAPSISWTMHYNPPPNLDPLADKGPNKTWQAVYPGVGLNVSALTFRDNGVQIGIGGHITLFRDLLIAGAGYNLNESYHGSYAFLGLSIFEGLSQLGLNLPAGK